MSPRSKKKEESGTGSRVEKPEQRSHTSMNKTLGQRSQRENQKLRSQSSMDESRNGEAGTKELKQRSQTTKKNILRSRNKEFVTRSRCKKPE